MSDDLIKRLRESADACEYTARSKLLREAADDIERKVAALQSIDDYYQTGGDLMSVVAQIAQEARAAVAAKTDE